MFFFCLVCQPQWHWNKIHIERATVWCLQPPVGFVFKREWLIRCDFSIVPHVQSLTLYMCFQSQSFDICHIRSHTHRNRHSNACTTFQPKYRCFFFCRYKKARKNIIVWKSEWKKQWIELVALTSVFCINE